MKLSHFLFCPVDQSVNVDCILNREWNRVVLYADTSILEEHTTFIPRVDWGENVAGMTL
jgi:hypothetical protein